MELTTSPLNIALSPATKERYMTMIHYGDDTNLTPRTARTEASSSRGSATTPVDNNNSNSSTNSNSSINKKNKHSPLGDAHSPDLFSMLLMEHAAAAAAASATDVPPQLHETGSSGQESSSTNQSGRPTMGSRSYSRELLSTFLEQATTDEEVALATTLKETMNRADLITSVETEQSYIIDASLARKKTTTTKTTTTKKKKKKNKESPMKKKLDSGAVEEDWSDWRETNKTINNLLQQQQQQQDDRVSPSSSSSTPRTGNVVLMDTSPLQGGTADDAANNDDGTAPAMLCFSTPQTAATRSIKINQDAASVKSDITGLTGVFTEQRPVANEVMLLVKQQELFIMEEEDQKKKKQRRLERQQQKLKKQQEQELKKKQQESSSSSSTPKKVAKSTMEKEIMTALSAAATTVTSPQQQPIKTKDPNRKVRFEAVFIRSHERILSANPSCTSGPPVGLGWRFAPERAFKIDSFESYRHKSRRSHRQLLLPRRVRERILFDLGYSPTDMAKAVRSSIRSKNQRKQTINNLGAAAKIEERLETAGRKMKNLFVGRKAGSSNKE